MPIRRRKGETLLEGVDKKTAKLNVERLPISSLKPHPKNPRKHPEPGTVAWGRLRSSLEHDYFDPLVWNKRNKKLVSGHLRAKVLKEMGVEDADVVVVEYDEPTHLARMIAANNPSGENDLPSLGAILEEIGEAPDFDMALTAMTDYDIAEMLGHVEREVVSEGEEDSEQEGEEEGEGGEVGWPPAVMKVLDDLKGQELEIHRGDVYSAGPHLVFCAGVVKEPRPWAAHLEGRWLLIRPGAHGLLRSDIHPSVVVDPDPLHVALLLTNYRKVHGKKSVKKVNT